MLSLRKENKGKMVHIMLSYIRVSPTKFTSGPTALGINVNRRKFHFENSPRKQKECVFKTARQK
jgi:hypothetical protein